MQSRFLSYTCYAIAAVALFAAVMLTAISFVVKDFRYYAESALDHLALETGYTLALDDISFTLLSGTGIQVHNLRMHASDRDDPVFRCSRVQIATGLLPLLRRHIAVETVVLERPSVRMNHSDYLTLRRLLPDPGEPPAPDSARRFFDFTFACNNVLITDGTFYYHNNPGTLNAAVDNVVARLERSHETGAYQLLCNGHVNAHAFDNAWTINGPVRLHLGTIEFSGPASEMLTADMHLSTDDLAISFSGETLTLPPAVLLARLHGDGRTAGMSAFDLSLPGHAALQGRAHMDFSLKPSPLLNVTLTSDWIALDPFVGEPLLNTLYPPWLAEHVDRLRGGEIKMTDAVWIGSPGTLFFNDTAALRADVELRRLAYALDEDRTLRLSQGRFACAAGEITGTAALEFFPGDSHTLHTTLRFPDSVPDLQGSVFSSVPAEALKTVLPDGLPLVLTSGQITAETQLRYAENLQLSAEIDLSRAEYRVADAVVKPLGLTNYLTVSFSADMPDAPPVYDIRCVVSDAASLTGRINLQGEPLFEGVYHIDAFDLSELAVPALSPAFEYQGKISAEGSVRTALNESQPWDARGHITLDTFRLIDPSDTAPLLTLDLDAAFSGHTADITSCSFVFGLSDCRFSGILENILPPRGTLAAESRFLDIDDFVRTVQKTMRRIPRKKNRPANTPSIFQQTHLKAPMRIQTVNFMNWTADNATTSFSYIDGAMLWDDVVLHAPGGQVLGSVLYDFADMRNQRLVLTADQSSVDFTWAVPGMSQTKTITGLLDLRGNFESAFYNHGGIVPNMTGDFTIRVTEGTLQKFTVLSKILSMFSLSRIIKLQGPDMQSTGMPYDLIKGNLTLTNGVMSTEDLVIKSSAMNLSAVGTLNIADEEIDFIVGAQPLETLGKIVGSVPIAGNIFTGEDKSLTVGYFRVKGPFSDTSVTPMPVKSLSTGVRKIFSSLLEIPWDIFQSGFSRENESAGDVQ
jgi:hypothetical protein